MIQQAGQVGLFEGILIFIGILWVFGFLRSIVYVPVVIKEKPKEPEEKPHKSTPKIDPGGEYTDYEEIK